MQHDNYKLNKKNGVLLGAAGTDELIIDDRPGHVLVASPTGGGKGLGPMMGTLLNNKDSVFVTDIKGELFEKTAGFRSQFSKIRLYDPLNSLGSSSRIAINPLLDITIGRKSIEHCTVLAQALINRSCLRDDIIDTARKWCSALLLYIYYCEDPQNRHCGYLLDLLARGINSKAQVGFGKLLAECSFSSHPELPADHDWSTERLNSELLEVRAYIRGLGEQMCNVPAKLGVKIVLTLSLHLSIFRRTALNSYESTISLRSFVNSPTPQSLYLVAPPQDIAVVAPVMRAITDLVSSLIIENDKRLEEPAARAGASYCPLTFLLDEAPKFNHYTTLMDNLPLLGKYHARVVLFASSLNMLSKIYGKNSIIFSNFPLKLFMGIEDLDEATAIHEYVNESVIDYTSGALGNKLSAKNPGQLIHYIHSEPQENRSLLLIEDLPGLIVKRAYYFDYPEMRARAAITYADQ